MMSRFSVKKRIITIVLAALFLLCFAGIAFAEDPAESINTETEETLTAEEYEAAVTEETGGDVIPEEEAGESAFVALEDPPAGEADVSAEAANEEAAPAEESPADTEEDVPAEIPDNEEADGPGEVLSEEEAVPADTEEPEETGEFSYSAVTADGLTAVTVTGNDINVKGVLIEAVQNDSLEKRALEAVGPDVPQFCSVNLFDISLIDETGSVIEPEGTVSVEITGAGLVSDDADYSIVHFTPSEDEIISGLSVSDEALYFETDSFSVYAIVSEGGEYTSAVIGDFEISVGDGTFVITDETGEKVIDENGETVCEITDNVLHIYKSLTVKNSADAAQTSQSIIVKESCDVTLDGVNIVSGQGPGILIESQNTVNLILADGSDNNVTGANGVNINHVAGSFAGIEVEFEFENGENPSNKMATLIISGNGSLTATGENNAAGIGGSNSAGGSKGKGLYGNIIIESGNVTANGKGNGAGIGSSDNPGDGTSSGSYKKTGYNTWGTITINGGNVKANGGSSGNGGAGIGGGNHTDSGKIVINGGTVVAEGSTGIGSGFGSSKNSGTGGDKGPGYYLATVEINGGTITATGRSYGGAGIGGSVYGDAEITITGGDITAVGGGGTNYHHGGAGIGGGYESHAVVNISGGTINATGGCAAAGIGSGGSPNSNPARGINGRGDAANIDGTTVNISGGNITAYGGENGGAGIGGGNGADKVNVNISDGTVKSYGAKSSESDKKGGAGIGSGYNAEGAEPNYMVNTDTSVTITGGSVIAVGGWGASGIGSGAENKTADSITIDAENSDIEAYADGTKFAIDTRQLKADGNTESIREGRDITGNMLQGTFVHAGQIGDYEQNPEGLKSIIVSNDRDSAGFQQELKLMPDGYRSFAIDVPEAGSYTVYTDESSIGHGEGRFFNKCDVEYFDESRITARNIQYEAKEGELCDNFYLYPVKSIEIKKSIAADDSVMDKINLTLYFAVQEWSEDHSGKFLTNPDGSKMLKTIEIVEGIPQSNAFFVDIEDKQYEIWEMDENGNSMEQGTKFDAVELKRIETRHGEGDDNNAVINDEIWTDTVTVINTFAAVDPPVDPDDPPVDPDDPPVDPDDPPEDPDDVPEGPDEPSNDPVKPEPPEDSEAPDTGDDSRVSDYMIIAAAAGAAAVVLGIRRKNYGGRHAR